jgi:hypothetical protein
VVHSTKEQEEEQAARVSTGFEKATGTFSRRCSEPPNDFERQRDDISTRTCSEAFLQIPAFPRYRFRQELV